MKNKWYNSFLNDEQRNNIALVIYMPFYVVLALIGSCSMKISGYLMSKVDTNNQDLNVALEKSIAASNISLIWCWSEKWIYNIAHGLNDFFQIPEELR